MTVAVLTAAKESVAMGSAILNSIAPEEPKVVVPEYGETADIQDKEVSMEQLCSISTYDQWTPLSVSGQLPKPRYKHGAVVIQQKMYVFGGNHNGRYLGDIQVLDFKTLSWSKLEAKSQAEPSESAGAVPFSACAGHSVIQWGNKILCLAGHTREPAESLSVKEFDPQTCTWSTLRTYGRSPSSRGGQSVTLVGDTLVVFGGEGHGRSLLNDLHILDLETMTWDEFETTGTPPSPRSEHAAACFAERYLLIFGGGSHSTCFSDLHLLDTQTMEWSRPKQQGVTPESRAGHAGVTIGEYWFITGGGNSRKGVSDTLVLNLSTYEWSVLTNLEARAPPVSEAYALKASLKPSVPSQQINESDTNGFSPLSVAENSSRKVIFEIEELKDEKELHLVQDQLSIEQTRASKFENEISDIQQRLQKMDTLEKEIESLRYELDSTVSEEESSSGNELHRSRGFWRWNG
ncbi:Acyl-CoA-binding domain-containing protein 4 [Zea mays]|uniref:Acyl-CoA-binding domain-containing protein 4 n=1 Tax=Zea mays TaxID=4577 RepID=A0A1D6MXN0_MAIZE|nr:Acyl-CoA-binding domain-containing protein 4 [Zea mays]